MNLRSQTLCAWCGFLCPVFMFAGLWPAAQFFPPTLPSADAQTIADLYLGNPGGIRLATILFLIAGACFAAFSASVAAQMRRMETRPTPVLSYAQLISGAVGTTFFVIPAMLWTAAAFRPERDPQITQALNDLGWLFFVMPATLPVLQNMALGFAVLGDKRPAPVMPRWIGFLNLWIALLYVPGLLVTYFKSGPFAWNGVLAFWIPGGVFSVWFYIVAAYVLKAIRQQAAETAA